MTHMTGRPGPGPSSIYNCLLTSCFCLFHKSVTKSIITDLTPIRTSLRNALIRYFTIYNITCRVTIKKKEKWNRKLQIAYFFSRQVLKCQSAKKYFEHSILKKTWKSEGKERTDFTFLARNSFQMFFFVHCLFTFLVFGHFVMEYQLVLFIITEYKVAK